MDSRWAFPRVISVRRWYFICPNWIHCLLLPYVTYWRRNEGGKQQRFRFRQDLQIFPTLHWHVYSEYSQSKSANVHAFKMHFLSGTTNLMSLTAAWKSGAAAGVDSRSGANTGHLSKRNVTQNDDCGVSRILKLEKNEMTLPIFGRWSQQKN